MEIQPPVAPHHFAFMVHALECFGLTEERNDGTTLPATSLQEP